MTEKTLREAVMMAQLIGVADFMAELVASNILTIKDNDYTQDEAIDRLEWLRSYIKTMRTALAAPEAEPVAYKVGCLLTVNDDQYPALPGLFGQLWDGEVVAARVYGNSREEVNARVAALNVKPSAPMERQPLTDEQIEHLQDTHVGGPTPSYPLDSSDWVNFARAIEAAHNIK